jgi:predicted RNA-binding Zn-ribbon protein involved in translation (DUF1610 family)
MMDVVFLSIAALIVLALAVYAAIRAAGAIGDRLGAEDTTACPRCRSLRIYQFARDNGPPGWRCDACGWEWPVT